MARLTVCKRALPCVPLFLSPFRFSLFIFRFFPLFEMCLKTYFLLSIIFLLYLLCILPCVPFVIFFSLSYTDSYAKRCVYQCPYRFICSSFTAFGIIFPFYHFLSSSFLSSFAASNLQPPYSLPHHTAFIFSLSFYERQTSPLRLLHHLHLSLFHATISSPLHLFL